MNNTVTPRAGRWLMWTAVLVLLLLLVVVWWLASPSPSGAATATLRPYDNAVVLRGEVVYANNCARCHGVNLEGEANWRVRLPNGKLPAPPHDETGHTWHHPDGYLVAVTTHGLEKVLGQTYPNDMPAYGDTLSQDDVVAVLSYIKSRWSPAVRARHDQVNAQYQRAQGG
ncbi:MAG: c-type cytochrome [Burkholderiaceae bacterium]